MSAVISECGTYRYQLTRELRDYTNEWCLPWVMLNPSVADANINDPTIRRIMEFSRRWGYGSIKVINLYALRSSKPAALWLHDDPVGPDNGWWIHKTMEEVGYGDVMLAWGNHAKPERVKQFVELMNCHSKVRLLCVDTNKNGSPQHPLYIKADVLRKIWRP